MTQPPQALVDFILLQAFPGYTLAELDEEDDETVSDWLLILQQKAGVAAEQARKDGRR